MASVLVISGRVPNTGTLSLDSRFRIFEQWMKQLDLFVFPSKQGVILKMVDPVLVVSGCAWRHSCEGRRADSK
jgi:hypothetical protein